jgi:hypothetical protein
VDTADLKSLSEVSKRMYDVSVPYLYESITISMDELFMTKLRGNVGPMYFGHFKHMRDLCFKAPFHKKLQHRRPHEMRDGIRCKFLANELHWM